MRLDLESVLLGERTIVLFERSQDLAVAGQGEFPLG
jgi:hypothetical protein